MQHKLQPFLRHAMAALSFLLAAQAGAEEMTEQERDVLYNAIFSSPPPQAMWWETTGGGYPAPPTSQSEQDMERDQYMPEQQYGERASEIKAMMGGVLSDAGARDFVNRNLPRPVLNIPSEMLPRVAPAAYATVGAYVVTRAADRVFDGKGGAGESLTLKQEMVRAAGREVARQSVVMAADGARLAAGASAKAAGKVIDKAGVR